MANKNTVLIKRYVIPITLEFAGTTNIYGESLAHALEKYLSSKTQRCPGNMKRVRKRIEAVDIDYESILKYNPGVVTQEVLESITDYCFKVWGSNGTGIAIPEQLELFKSEESEIEVKDLTSSKTLVLRDRFDNDMVDEIQDKFPGKTWKYLGHGVFTSDDYTCSITVHKLYNDNTQEYPEELRKDIVYGTDSIARIIGQLGLKVKSIISPSAAIRTLTPVQEVSKSPKSNKIEVEEVQVVDEEEVKPEGETSGTK